MGNTTINIIIPINGEDIILYCLEILQFTVPGAKSTILFFEEKAASCKKNEAPVNEGLFFTINTLYGIARYLRWSG